MNDILEPGMIVRHPGAPEWGEGQVQSRIGDRITVKGFLNRKSRMSAQPVLHATEIRASKEQ